MKSYLRRLDPTNLGYLGFLAIPGWLSDSLRPLAILGLFFLFWLWPYVSMLWSSRSDSEDPTRWIHLGDWRYYAKYFATLVPSLLNPFVLATSFGQIGGQLVVLARHSWRLPGINERTQAVSYRLPFEGTWTVLNGSIDTDHSHSWSIYTQRYAYDFAITDEQGRTHRGSGTSNEDYYCFERPILAPAAGTVVSVRDTHRDSPHPGGWLDVFQRDIRGNYVTIDHGGEYSVFAHLTPGSIPLKEGQQVEQGDLIGRCGNSGNSTEPHLHFHVQDHPRFFLGMGLPVQFEHVEVEHSAENVSKKLEQTYIEAGQRVRPR